MTTTLQSQPTQLRPGRPWRVVLFGAACVGAGLWCGLLLRSEPRVWHAGDAQPGELKLAPPSFADIVAKVGAGVVTVRAEFDPQGEGEEASATDKPTAPPPPTGTAAGHTAGEPSPASNRTEPVFRSAPGQRTGSGFLVKSQGLVVTSRHLVAGARTLRVLVTDRGTYRGEVVGEDRAADLALLRLCDAPDDLPALPLGECEGLRAGDWIVAVGNPFGFSQTVTAGVVSFVGRHLHTDLGVTSDYLQFSAPVNPGSSGCPLFDGTGRVVGVTTQAATAAQGISFAVPSKTLKWSLDAMVEARDGKVRRGYLGIEFASRRFGDALDEHNGAVITKVARGEPAERAGLRRGDVVLAVDGQTVADAGCLHDRIIRGRPGSRIRLQLLRDGRVCEPVEAELGELSSLRSLGHPN